MSAQKSGRQSPDPEDATEQVGENASGHAGTAPSDTHAKEQSDKQKENELESNPVHPLDKAADAKVSKDGRGPGI